MKKYNSNFECISCNKSFIYPHNGTIKCPACNYYFCDRHLPIYRHYGVCPICLAIHESTTDNLLDNLLNIPYICCNKR